MKFSKGHIFLCLDNQNPSLLLSLDLSTYSWMCCWSTGSSTTYFIVNDAYLLGSKSVGLVRSAPLRCLHASTYDV